jgi:hypothetical protein
LTNQYLVGWVPCSAATKQVRFNEGVWAGIKNGQLLTLAASEFDVLLTADKGIEHQHNLATLPIAVLIVLSRSNRMEDMAPAVPAILEALSELQPRAIRKLAA